MDTVEFVIYSKSFEWQPYCHGQITRKIGGRSKEVLLYFPDETVSPTVINLDLLQLEIEFLG